MSATKLVLPKPMLKPKMSRPLHVETTTDSEPVAPKLPAPATTVSAPMPVSMPVPKKKPAPSLKKTVKSTETTEDNVKVTAPTIVTKPVAKLPAPTTVATPITTAAETPPTISLVGRKITSIREMTAEEMASEGWTQNVRVIVLDNGLMLYPSQDSEGNEGGFLFGRDPTCPIDRQFFHV